MIKRHKNALQTSRQVHLTCNDKRFDVAHFYVIIFSILSFLVYNRIPEVNYKTAKTYNMSDTESDIEDIPHDEIVKKLQVPEFQDSPTSSGGNIIK